MRNLTRSRLVTLITLFAIIIPTVAIAGSVLVPPATVSGNTTSPSFQATNTGTGPALYAVSKSTTGLSSTLTSVNMSTTAGSALVGTSAGNAIQGTSTLANGVVGASKNFNGIVGTSTNGAGVMGRSTNGNGIAGLTSAKPTTITYAAVVGTDSSPASPSPAGCTPVCYDQGVLGVSLHHFGVGGIGGPPPFNFDAGCCGAGFGVFGDGENTGVMALGGQVGLQAVAEDVGINVYALYGNALDASVATDVRPNTQIAVNARDDETASSCPACAPNAALAGYSRDGYAVYSNTANGVGLRIDMNGTKDAIFVKSSSFGGPIMSLDANGNLTITGTLVQNGAPQYVSSSARGRQVTYAPQQTAPTVEDFGTGELRSGYGYVQLSASLLPVIDPSREYLVFLTPEGDSKGLFVTDKSATGFSVRENMGGHSNIRFQFRIVSVARSSNQQKSLLIHDETSLMRPPMTTMPKKLNVKIFRQR